MIGLTAKQLAVPRFIEGFWQAQFCTRAYWVAPSYREISAGTGYNLSSVFYTCRDLMSRGMRRA